jgi:hypothetical protein
VVGMCHIAACALCRWGWIDDCVNGGGSYALVLAGGQGSYGF